MTWFLLAIAGWLLNLTDHSITDGNVIVLGQWTFYLLVARPLDFSGIQNIIKANKNQQVEENYEIQ